MDWPYVALLVAGLLLIALAVWLIYRLGGPRADGWSRAGLPLATGRYSAIPARLRPATAA